MKECVQIKNALIKISALLKIIIGNGQVSRCENRVLE